MATQRDKKRTSKQGKQTEIVDNAQAPEQSQQPDIEARRTRLKALIGLGKERGYLTYAEINDHLPDDVLDAEQIEGVISMIGDIGIQHVVRQMVVDLGVSEVAAFLAEHDQVLQARAARFGVSRGEFLALEFLDQRLFLGGQLVAPARFDFDLGLGLVDLLLFEQDLFGGSFDFRQSFVFLRDFLLRRRAGFDFGAGR